MVIHDLKHPTESLVAQLKNVKTMLNDAVLQSKAIMNQSI
jgi:hypothetical protein